MTAEDYIYQWCDETYKGGKELGDWTTKEVMKFANDFGKQQWNAALEAAAEWAQSKLQPLIDAQDEYITWLEEHRRFPMYNDELADMSVYIQKIEEAKNGI